MAVNDLHLSCIEKAIQKGKKQFVPSNKQFEYTFSDGSTLLSPILDGQAEREELEKHEKGTFIKYILPA